MMDAHDASCPCKRIKFSLSSFTAAEYGNVEALMAAQQKSGRRARSQPCSLDETGSCTPLHLAAQHGHVAVTAFLLQSQGISAPMAAYSSSSIPFPSSCGNSSVDDGGKRAATPLHRAAYSGAVSTMRLLIGQPPIQVESLLAVDRSFGDGRTPLHKATAGGRFLAVQLIIDALIEAQYLPQALQFRDAMDQTPLQVAMEMRTRKEDERLGVARWNTVAGGLPDWEKCYWLLLCAERSYQEPTFGTTEELPCSKLYPIPTHLIHSSFALQCEKCDSNEATNNQTRMWESSLRSTLQARAEQKISHAKAKTRQWDHACERVSSPDQCLVVPTRTHQSKAEMHPTSLISTTNPFIAVQTSIPAVTSPDPPRGTVCSECQRNTFTVYKRRGKLVCFQCR